MMKVGDLVTDDWGRLALILDIGNIWNDAVVIKFLDSGNIHNTFKSCIKPLEEI